MFICDIMLDHWPKVIPGDWVIEYENKIVKRSDVAKCECGMIIATYYYEEDYSGLTQDRWDKFYAQMRRELSLMWGNI